MLCVTSLKIVINRRGHPFRVYHHPREVVVHPQAGEVEIFSSDGSILEKYNLIKKDLSWLEDKENDTAEIVLTLEVGEIIQL
jgi:hypothetical protein